jgi:hypothetical protein
MPRRCWATKLAAVLMVVVGASVGKYLYKKLGEDIYPCISIEHVLENARTGDLIYFRWRGVDILHSVVSYFTHIGMILRDPITDEVFILETHREGDTDHMGFYNFKGMNAYSLKDRIAHYKGDLYYGKLRIEVSDIDTKVKECMAMCQDIPYDEEHRSHFINTCMLCMPTTRRESESMFCSEFIGFKLRHLKLIPEDAPISCFSPSSFVGMRSVDGEILYDTPHKIQKQ